MWRGETIQIRCVDAFFFENGDLDTCGQDQRQLKLEQAAFDKYISPQ